MIFFNRVSQTPPFTRLEGAFQKSQGVECRRFFVTAFSLRLLPYRFPFRPRFTFLGTEFVT